MFHALSHFLLDLGKGNLVSLSLPSYPNMTAKVYPSFDQAALKAPVVFTECKLKHCSDLKYHHALKPGFVAFQSILLALCTNSFTSPGKLQCSASC